MPEPDLSLFDRSNLVAWCIVPYDTRGRTPRERAAMLAGLGITGFAWDWRPEHVPGFDEELDALAEFDIDLTALWAPVPLPDDDDGSVGTVDAELRSLISQVGARGLSTQLWACTEFGVPGPFTALPQPEHAARVRRTADHLEPLVALARENGLGVALYNHMGWFGEPENQIEVIETLTERDLGGVGIVYQQHHGHAHLDRFERLLPLMAPHLRAFGINGSVPGAHWGGRKIHPYGRGPRDVELARILATSGWRGPVSLLGHTMDDAEERLLDNLEGLDWVVEELVAGDARSGSAGPPPARIPEPVWPH